MDVKIAKNYEELREIASAFTDASPKPPQGDHGPTLSEKKKRISTLIDVLTGIGSLETASKNQIIVTPTKQRHDGSEFILADQFKCWCKLLEHLASSPLDEDDIIVIDSISSN